MRPLDRRSRQVLEGGHTGRGGGQAGGRGGQAGRGGGLAAGGGGAMRSHMRPLNRRLLNYGNQPLATPTNQEPPLADRAKRACPVEPAQQQRSSNNVTIIFGPRHINLILLFK